MGASEEKITLAELDAVERLDASLRDTTPGAADFARRQGAEVKLAEMAPRLARAYLALLTSQVADTEKSAQLVHETYIRGRTEAIVEAATFLRGAAVAQIRAMSEPGESPIQACASAIVRHEAYRGQ